MGDSKNSFVYRTIKKVIDNFKAQKLDKRLQKYHEKYQKGDCNLKSTDTIDYSDKSSSSSVSKVVDKNTRLLSFLVILFCKQGIGDDMIPGTTSEEAI